MGSWKGRRNQYIMLVKDMYCKVLIRGKRLPDFPHEVRLGYLISEVGDEYVSTAPLWPQMSMQNQCF